MLRAFSAGLLASSASAQAWGTSGSWQTIAPTTSVTGPGGFAARPVSVGGNVVWLGNNTATGLQALWSFDAARRAWSKWPDLPAAFQPTQPRHGHRVLQLFIQLARGALHLKLGAVVRDVFHDFAEA